MLLRVALVEGACELPHGWWLVSSTSSATPACPGPTCRVMLGLHPDADSGATSQQQQPTPPLQQQTAAAQQPPQPRGAEGAPGSGGAGSSSAPVFSRLLEHTASSLARCADRVHHPPPSVAAQQQPQHNQQQQPAAAAAVAPPASRAAFGSPLPPPRSRGSTAGQEGQQARADAGSTPVGAEGQTPEGTGEVGEEG